MARYWTKNRVKATAWKIGHELADSYPYRVFDPETGKQVALCIRRETAEAIVKDLEERGFTEYGF